LKENLKERIEKLKIEEINLEKVLMKKIIANMMEQDQKLKLIIKKVKESLKKMIK
jgi:hypothetical protein